MSLAKAKTRKRKALTCVDDGGTCGLGGYCHQCPNLPSKSVAKRMAVQEPRKK